MPPSSFTVTRLAGVGDLRRLLAAVPAGTSCTAFQTTAWLEAWYGEIAPATGSEPVLLAVQESGQLAAVLPLVLRDDQGLRVIEAADLGVSDYNAPILGPAAPTDTAGATALWQAARPALPPADLLRLFKVPVTVAGRPNPLALLPIAAPSRLFGNVVEVGAGSIDAFLRSRGRKFRKEYGRYLRRLEHRGRVRLKQVTGGEEALAVLAQLEQHQSGRMAGHKDGYLLDQPHYARHYRRLAERGLADRFAELYYLSVDEVPIAFLFGVTHEGAFSLLRLTHIGGDWEQCSPGRLLVVETMRALADRGIRRFDMTIGDYMFKRSFDPVVYPLVEVIRPLSWRGLATGGIAVAKQQVRGSPRLLRLVDTLRGRAAGPKPPGEGGE